MFLAAVPFFNLSSSKSFSLCEKKAFSEELQTALKAKQPSNPKPKPTKVEISPLARFLNIPDKITDATGPLSSINIFQLKRKFVIHRTVNATKIFIFSRRPVENRLILCRAITSFRVGITFTAVHSSHHLHG